MNTRGSRYPRGTSPDPMSQIWLDIVNAIPESPGLYKVMAGDEVLYIGTSKKMRERLVAHGMVFQFLLHKADRVVFTKTTMNDDGRRRWEKDAIEAQRPILNTVYNGERFTGYELERKCISCNETKPSFLFTPSEIKHRGASIVCMKCQHEHRFGTGSPMRIMGRQSGPEVEQPAKSIECHWCNEVALRIVGFRGACKKHIQKAVDLRKDQGRRLDPGSGEIERRRREMDYKDLNRAKSWAAVK